MYQKVGLIGVLNFVTMVHAKCLFLSSPLLQIAGKLWTPGGGVDDGSDGWEGVQPMIGQPSALRLMW